MRKVLAFDLGASSGRAVRARMTPGGLSCEEIHRFENRPLERDGHLYWDFPALLREVQSGIEKAGDVDSIGFDTWGVDFGALDEKGNLLELPRHYRDTRTRGWAKRAVQQLGADRLYRHTGIQNLDFNTLYQLGAMKEKDPGLWEKVDRILFMPDLFAYSLCGNMVCERSIASTSQMLNPVSRTWSKRLMEAFGVPERILAPLVDYGTVIGDYEGKKIISVAGHDTQSAIAAMVCDDKSAAFVSCGTWSLVGMQLDAPELTIESGELGFSNELGVEGKINYLKNICGLWLLQECRHEWRRGKKETSYAYLESAAKKSAPYRSFVDTDAPDFVAPGDMTGRIRAYCARTGQPEPGTPGEIVRCIYESLAMKYRHTIERLESVSGRRLTEFNILGGGSRSALLCSLTADICRIPVVAGPTEATALGNIVVQLEALGDLKSHAEAKELIRKSEACRRYEPCGEDPQEAYRRYCRLLEEEGKS